MCGFVGIWDPSTAHQHADQLHHVKNMAKALRHRGPDDAHSWSESSGLYLGHTRLSIHDLSPAGKQPMASNCGRFTVAFNGEIYNYRQLRDDLGKQGLSFRTDCDTEVLLSAISHWGLEAALEKFNGMFAFALWDSKNRQLSLARDRIGKKPLYFGIFGGQLLFGSELKALRRHPAFQADINPTAVRLYLEHSYIPGNQSIYTDAHKLPAASIVTLEAAQLVSSATVMSQVRNYWDPIANYCQLSTQSHSIDENDALNELDKHLRQAVNLRLDADVPVGLLLSGGIDSSLVASAAQAESASPINTFSVGFDDFEKSEAESAKKIAKYLGCSHNELNVSGADALSLVPSLPSIYDEPFSDTSQIPTLLICKLASQKVTVALSGDGGDELFFGYKRYRSSARIWQQLRKFNLVRKPAGHILSAVGNHLPGDNRLINHGATALADQLLDLYIIRQQTIQNPDRLLVNHFGSNTELADRIRHIQLGTEEDKLMLLDYCVYLCDNILVKTDRASMANSLELRSPLLDRNITELAWKLPFSLKYQNGRGKYLLRKLLDRYLPTELTDRPKQGFGAPVKLWLNSSLAEWAEDLLEPGRVKRQGLFDPHHLYALWNKTKGASSGHSKIWTLLMFQAWYEKHME